MAGPSIQWSALMCVTCAVTLVAAVCDINDCTSNRSPFIPVSCVEYTDYLNCVKAEYDSCIDDASRSRVMMDIYYSGTGGVPYCGYNLTQIQRMMAAHTGLMTSVFNTSGPAVMMMGDDGPYDDGPFDDGPMDDGPFDDGPFDDGPFDDGPFDDIGERGFVNPAFMNPSASGGPTGVNSQGRLHNQHQGQPRGSVPGRTRQQHLPKAPTVQPLNRGGAARHINDRSTGPSTMKFGWLALICSIILPLLFITE